MGKKKPVTIGGRQFPSKKEAREHFTNILNKHPLGTKLSNGELNDVKSLLNCHPRARQKIGCGMSSIKIDKGFVPGNRCFHIIRTDGSEEDFSIGKCIN